MVSNKEPNTNNAFNGGIMLRFINLQSPNCIVFFYFSSSASVGDRVRLSVELLQSTFDEFLVSRIEEYTTTLYEQLEFRHMKDSIG